MVSPQPVYMDQIVDFGILGALMIGVAGAFKALGLRRRAGAASVLATTLVAIYSLAYIYHTYYGVSTPLVDSVLNAGTVLTNFVSGSPVLEGGVHNISAPPLLNQPYNNDLLNAVYYIGIFTYTTIVALALVSTSTVVTIARFIRDLVKRK